MEQVDTMPNVRAAIMNAFDLADSFGSTKPVLRESIIAGIQQNAGEFSDGYHTFDELYDHRITLYIALCKAIRNDLLKGSLSEYNTWRSKRHSDGEVCFGTGTQFILGIGMKSGQQISYHIPIERWDETDFARTLEKAPEWDGHTSADVLERLKNL